MNKKTLFRLFCLVSLMSSCSRGSSSVSGEASSSQEPSVSLGNSFGSDMDSSSDSSSDSSVNEKAFLKEQGCREAAYVEWKKNSQATGYNVFYKLKDGAGWTKIDTELIREYPDYMRADIVGLKEGEYEVMMTPIINGALDESRQLVSGTIKVNPYYRDGYAFKDGTSSGAYNEDGTLKDNALVIYVTNDNINTLTGTVTSNSKGGTYSFTGAEDVFTYLKKGFDKRAVDFRFIGNIKTIPTGTNKPKGDFLIDLSDKYTGGMTVEGIGDDATFNGFGLRIKGANNFEARNLGFMNVASDEKDSISLQQDNNYCWIHNCDIFYGEKGSDEDQAKGDGSMDCKNSNHITMSYLHFYDDGKCSLLGMKDIEQAGYYVTYDHNWFDHSDSRHPRARRYSAHVYNNYFDGNSKYGIGASLLSNVFAEGNYFRNCKFPMLTSMQGSDILDSSDGTGTFSSEDGGIIKSYDNYMTGQKNYRPYSSSNTVEFDAYEASSRTDKIPETITGKQGGHIYNNFDSDSSTADETKVLLKAEEVPAYVKANAGRIDGGDVSFAFSDSDDTSYSLNAELKALVENYTGTLVSIGGFSI